MEVIKAAKAQDKITRMAAYCRVSTGSDEQKDSLEAQIKHYKDYARTHENVKMVGIYYDEGISGTHAKTRPGLMDLMLECEEGKIDMVITKSISRLSRNTTDCIEIVRTLLDLDVGVIFEKENINTRHMEGELMLSIMGSLAENELKSISQNVSWGVKNRFKNGTYKYSYAPYGYDLDDGQLVINKEEANVVKLIYQKYTQIKGAVVIADELNGMGLKPRKSSKWSRSTVLNILNNPVYTGDALFQKTYTDDSFFRHVNSGEKDQYLVRDHHEAIITREVFDKVQEIKKAKTEKFKIRKSEQGCFTGKLICENCGHTLRRYQDYRIRDGKKVRFFAWACPNKGVDHCRVREKDIEHAFNLMIIKLIQYRNIIIGPLYQIASDSMPLMVETISTSIAHEIDDYTKEKTDGMLTVYQKKEVIRLWKFLQRHEKPGSFNRKLFEKFVDHASFTESHHIKFVLKCGLELEEVID